MTLIIKPQLSGYIYCIQIFNLNIFKVGMTKNSRKQLLTRYKTTYPINTVLLFSEVHDRKKAEKLLLEKTNAFRINNSEVINVDYNFIRRVFLEVEQEYPSLNTFISNTSIENLTKYNKETRQNLHKYFY
jgi:hypothetical protein